MKRIGYLGPKGTFSQETLDANLSGEFEEDVAYHTIPEVLFAVQSGEIDAGLVPIENSIEGTVESRLTRWLSKPTWLSSMRW